MSGQVFKKFKYLLSDKHDEDMTMFCTAGLILFMLNQHRSFPSSEALLSSHSFILHCLESEVFVSEQEQKGKVPQQGCSHGFHRTFLHVSCFSTRVRVLRWSFTARPTRSSTSANRGSVSGESGRLSDGSLLRSNTSGGLWYVTKSPWHMHTLVS